MDILYQIFVSVLDAVIVVFFLYEFMNRKAIGISEMVLFVTHTVAGVLANTEIAANAFWTAMTGVMYLGYTFFVGRKHIGRALTGAVMTFVTAGLTSMAAMYFSATLLGIRFEDLIEFCSDSHSLIVIVLQKVLLFSAFLVILRLAKTQTLVNLKKRELVLIASILVMISCILIIIFYMVFTMDISEKGMENYGLVSLFLLFLTGGIFCFILRMNRMNQEQLKSEKQLLFYQTQARNMENFQAEYEHMRCLRHDLRHHFDIAVGMLELGRQEDALNYLKNVSGNIFEHMTQFVDVGNEVVNAAINSKLVVGKEKGVSFALKMDGACRFSKEEEMEAGIILANLLDNAIAAAMHAETKEVSMTTRMINEYMEFVIENSFSQKFEEEKRPTKEHGWGLISVKGMVKKLDGEIHTEKADEQYRVVLLLRNSAHLPKREG